MNIFSFNTFHVCILLDALLIGVGTMENVQKVRYRLNPFFKQHGIRGEVMTTVSIFLVFQFKNVQRPLFYVWY